MPEVHKVALLIETSNRYGRDLLYGVRDWVQKSGEKWSIRFTEQARRASLPGWLADWEGDGIIARVDSAQAATVLRRAKIPVVDVSADRPSSEFPRVSIDNAAVTRLALAHLKDKGLRHFAFIGDKRFIWSRQRADEFRRVMAAETKPNRIYKEPAADSQGSDSELRSIARWLQGLPRPVGIVACYDNRALQVLEAAQLCGLAVPDDVAVIGVDDDEVLCQLCNPPLTSVLPNARLTGYEAAARLSRLMHGERFASQTHYIEPIRVVERQSTDASAVSDPKIAAALRYITEHACDGIDVSDVLRAVPVSRTLFDRRFKALLGHSPHQHIVNRRIERAKNLLIDTDLSIAVIAELAGFLNASYLSTAFRRETGQTPYAYREKMRTSRMTSG
ncbi:MAG: DNA-binding transcriptional regulator [Nibricoccus sp.]